MSTHWDGLIGVVEDFLAYEYRRDALWQLAQGNNLVQPEVRLYGKSHPTPRQMRWFADDPALTYSWSGVTLVPEPIPDPLNYLMRIIYAGYKPWSAGLNSVLMNVYRDGEDYIGWHSDDEPELGPSPAVFCYSLGATRDFVLRRKGDPRDKYTIPLRDNSLVLMKPGCQELAQHSLPKRKKVLEQRISFTFRALDSTAQCAQCAKPCIKRELLHDSLGGTLFTCSRACFDRVVSRMALSGVDGELWRSTWGRGMCFDGVRRVVLATHPSKSN